MYAIPHAFLTVVRHYSIPELWEIRAAALHIHLKSSFELSLD